MISAVSWTDRPGRNWVLPARVFGHPSHPSQPRDIEVGTQLGCRGVGLGCPGEQEEQRSDARRDLSGKRAEPAQHPTPKSSRTTSTATGTPSAAHSPGWGIQEADDHIADLSQSGLTPVYRNLSYTALRTDTDEVFRFIWENLELLEIDPRFYIHVEHVRPSVRVGPDSIVVAETVAEYVQFLEGTPAGLSRAIGLRVPKAVPPGTRVRVLGGGTIIFDQFGQAKYHHRKDIRDTRRQQRRLRYLVGNGLPDDDSLGVSDGMPAGQRFAILHQPDADPRQTW